MFSYQENLASLLNEEKKSEDVQALYKAFEEVMNILKAEDTKKYGEQMKTARSIPTSQAHMWGDWSGPAVQSRSRVTEEALTSLNKDFEASFMDEPNIAEKITSFCIKLLGEDYTYSRAKKHLEKYYIWKNYFEKVMLMNLTPKELLSLLLELKRKNPDLVIPFNLGQANALSEALNSLTSLTYTGRNLSFRNVKAIAETLKTNTTLTTLMFNGDSYCNGLALEGFKAVTEALKTNMTLTTFGFGCHNAEFGIEGGKAIAEALQVNTTLTTLELRSINLRVGGVKAIAEALKTNITLTTLVLKDETPDEGVKEIAEALKTNTTLTILGLKTTEEGSKAIAEALQVNTTLTTLKFECNYTSCSAGKGIRAIAEALKANKTLTTLEFRCDRIEAIKAVVEVLKTNTTLTTLRLKERAPDEVVKELAEALKINRTLTTLEFSCDWSVVKGIEAIAESLKINTTLTTLNIGPDFPNIPDKETMKSIEKLLKRNQELLCNEISRNFAIYQISQDVGDIILSYVDPTLLQTSSSASTKTFVPSYKTMQETKPDPLKTVLAKTTLEECSTKKDSGNLHPPS